MKSPVLKPTCKQDALQAQLLEIRPLGEAKFIIDHMHYLLRRCSARKIPRRESNETIRAASF
jgi:hypothetical protein